MSLILWLMLSHEIKVACAKVNVSVSSSNFSPQVLTPPSPLWLYTRRTQYNINII